MLERRRETGVDAAGLVRLFALLLLLSVWKVTLTPLFSHVTLITPDHQARLLGQFTPGPTATPFGSVFGMSDMPVATSTPFVLPTYTPYPTYTPAPSYELSNHRFSFYDPAIGKDKPEIAQINCDQWNYTTLTCDSPLRNGERWQDNYFISAACPYELYIAAAQFEIVSPEWLKILFPRGFTCKDTGDAVTGLYIDFLVPWRNMPMPYEQTPWGAPITLMRVR